MRIILQGFQMTSVCYIEALKIVLQGHYEISGVQATPL